MTTQLHEAGQRTRVTVDTDLKIVGKLAQFGSGMLQQVSEKLLSQFVDSLEAKLAASNTLLTVNGESPTPTVKSTAAEPVPIDLLELAGADKLKKYLPLLLGALALGVLVWVLRRRQ